jgi:hypothetical protein
MRSAAAPHPTGLRPATLPTNGGGMKTGDAVVVCTMTARLNDKHTSAFSRRECARVVLDSFGPKQRAQGMPGARCTRSLACKSKKAHEVVTTGSPEQSGIPRAMVLTASFVLSPVIGLCCHRRLAFTAKLDASVEASGPHDFAVRVVCCSSAACQRPPHPTPRS